MVYFLISCHIHNGAAIRTEEEEEEGAQSEMLSFASKFLLQERVWRVAQKLFSL